MFGKRIIFFLSLFVFLTSLQQLAHAQEDKEGVAIEAFEEQNYNKALPTFKELVRLYPDDTKLNYYYVVSALETKKGQIISDNNLKTALKYESAYDIYYYAAFYFELNEEWNDAIAFYEKFEEKAKRKEIKNLKIKEKIEYCRTQKAEIKETPPLVDLPKQEKIIIKENKAVSIPTKLSNTLINVQITPAVQLKHISLFKNKNAQANYIQLWQSKQQINTLTEEIQQLRKQYSQSTDLNEREKIAALILDDENKIQILRQSVLTLPNSIIPFEQKMWKDASETDIEKLNKANLSWEVKLGKIEKTPEKTEHKKVIIIETPQEEVIPDEYVYKIQIGAYRKKLPDYIKRLFKKLSAFRPVENYTDKKGIVVYTTGKAQNYPDALQLLKQVRREGVKDAIIAAYKNNTRITVREARQKTN